MKLPINNCRVLRWIVQVLWQCEWIALSALLIVYFPEQRTSANDDAYVFTPPGFTKPGVGKVASRETTGRLRLIIRDRTTAQPTACRLNVVGPDGNFYQPATNPLTPYSLTGQWPQAGKGNREGKAPIRYLGRFFYSTGKVELAVLAGSVRVEVWKGFEYAPIAKNVEVIAGEIKQVSIELERTVPMAAHGYYSGDPHLHFPRQTKADDRVILDLLEAEDIHFGSILAYNEPAGPYTGVMESMAAPQLHGLGKASICHRALTWLMSGQEYRSTTFGHLNLYWRDDLVLKGQKVDANNWPLYGRLARETRRLGG